MWIKRSKVFVVFVVLATLAAVTPLPVGVAAGRGAVSAPKLLPLVQAWSTPLGPCVFINKGGTDIGAVQIYRSTTRGSLGEKITSRPVSAPFYTDKSAKAGTTHYYTAKVVARKARGGSGRSHLRRAPDLLPQVKVVVAQPIAVPSPPKVDSSVRWPSVPKSLARAPRAVHVASRLPRPRVVISGPTTISVNTVWTPAMSPIYIRGGDVVVAAGKTLTIQPGVRVYFDVFDTGGTPGVDYETTANPTRKCDLTIHGALVANGTTTQPILFSSIQASLVATQPGPDPIIGDWGAIFFDGRGASQVSRCKIEFCDGIWAQGTARPYLLYNDIVNVNAPTGVKPYAAVYFDSAVTDAVTPRIKIVGNHIGSAYMGVLIEQLTTSGNATVDPLIQGNVINALTFGVTLDAEPAGTSVTGGDYTIKGSLLGNSINVNPGPLGVQISAITTGTGAARVQTVMTGNTVVAGVGGVGMMAFADSRQGVTEIRPAISGGSVTAGTMGMMFLADSAEDSATGPGAAVVNPSISSARVSGLSYAIYAAADSGGSGACLADPRLSAVTFESAVGMGLFAECDSAYGTASASPILTGCVGNAPLTGPAVICEASAAGGSKSAKANPVVTGGRLASAGAPALMNQAESLEGRAEAKASIIHVSKLFGAAGAIYSVAEGDDSSTARSSGGADASSLIDHSTVVGPSGGDAVTNQAASSGVGIAVASPRVNGSAVRSGMSSGLMCNAISAEGSAAAGPVLTDSTVYAGMGMGVFCMASVESTRAVANARANPSLLRTVSTGSTAIFPISMNAGAGTSSASPVAIDSYLRSETGIGVMTVSSIDGTGTAESKPIFTDTPVEGSAAGMVSAVDAAGPGAPQAARFGGTFTNCDFASAGSAVVATANSVLGGTDISPIFRLCRFVAPGGQAASFDAAGTGAAGTVVQNATTMENCAVTDSMIGVSAEARGTSASTTETVVNKSKITDTSINAGPGPGLELSASTLGSGLARNEARITRSPVVGGSEGIRLEASSGGFASAVCAPQVVGYRGTAVESMLGPALVGSATSSKGNATEIGQYKNLSLSGMGPGMTSVTEVGSVGTTAQAQPLIQSNIVHAKRGLATDGIEVETLAMPGGGIEVAPTIAGNTVTGAQGHGIQVEYDSPTQVKAAPVVSGNTVRQTGLAGIELPESGSGTTPDSSCTVTGNVIDRAGQSGVLINGYPGGLVQANRISYAGYGQIGPMPTESAGIVWSNSAGGTIKGNLIRDARNGVVLMGPGPYPVLSYNSFGDCLLYPGTRHTTVYAETSTVGAVSAQNNWWGYATSAEISETIVEATQGAVNYTPWLGSCRPRLTGLSAVKSGSVVKFTLTFDRPMNTATRTLAFGKTSPYNKYKVTGAWSGGGTVWKGTRSRIGLPTGVWMYFSGASDLPGCLMDSKSKKFKL